MSTCAFGGRWAACGGSVAAVGAPVVVRPVVPARAAPGGRHGWGGRRQCGGGGHGHGTRALQQGVDLGLLGFDGLGLRLLGLGVAPEGLLREPGQFVAVARVEELGLVVGRFGGLLVEQPRLQQRKGTELALALRSAVFVMGHQRAFRWLRRFYTGMPPTSMV
jgi:hypothetical protein